MAADLMTFANAVREVLGLDPLDTKDQHGRGLSSSDRGRCLSEQERDAIRFYVEPAFGGTGQTPRRGSGA